MEGGEVEDEAPAETTLKEFVAELAERQAGQHEPTMSAVTLATLHSAKGLEWDCVYIAGASEGLLPIGYAKTEHAVEEERRLFYVACTRARDRLLVTGIAPGSEFLADLRAADDAAYVAVEAVRGSDKVLIILS